MTLRLREDLHWCVSGGRVVLLDLLADRYFCVPAGVDDAFLRAVRGVATEPDRDRLVELIDRGLLLDGCGGSAPEAGPAIPRVEGELFEDALPRAKAGDILTVMVLQAVAAWQLRRQPLSAVARDMARRGEAAKRRPPPDQERLRAIAAAFAAGSLVFREADRCLPRALAAHAACCREGIAASVVLGVQLDPFRAHAWAQIGARVLIGDYEQVRLFTPIAALG